MSLDEDTVLTFDPGVNDFDVDGDPLQLQVATGPAHGSLQIGADGRFTYTPDADFHGEAAQHVSHVYDQGHAMVTYISERFGREGRNRWLRELATGASLNDSTTKVLGLGFEQLDREWRESLKAAPDKPAAGDDPHDK